MAAGRADALAVFPNAVILANMRRVADLAIKQRLPSKEWPDAGGLMAYGVDVVPLFRRATVFVDKILRRANPADLPIEQAIEFRLIINLKPAKALGLTIPQSLVLRADALIQ